MPKKLAPAAVWQELMAVRGLALGRSAAIDHPDVEPVPFDDVKATLPHLSRIIRAMVELPLVAGMRPMEVRLMRGADIDRHGLVVEGGVRISARNRGLPSRPSVTFSFSSRPAGAVAVAGVAGVAGVDRVSREGQVRASCS